MTPPVPSPQPPTPIRHSPEDLTVSVDTALPLADLQTALAKHGQWLPIDPPGQPTVRALLDGNLSGPRRYGYGTIREHVLGMKIQLADGRVIKAGGQVVKNVAGYDLCRLFTGAQGNLGRILEATFKVQPLPETEIIVAHRCATLDEAAALIEAVLAAPLLPVILDLVAPATVVVGFAGAREDVAWQRAEAARLGITEPATLDYDRAWPGQFSVLPSRLIEALRDLRAPEFVARAGNGVIGINGTVPSASPGNLARRLEEAFRG